MLDGPTTWDNYKQTLMGVLLWKPKEVRGAACVDVVHAIIGHIKHTTWNSYREGKNLERLAIAIGVAFGSMQGDFKDIFDYSTTEKETEEKDLFDDETIKNMCRHFPAHL